MSTQVCQLQSGDSQSQCPQPQLDEHRLSELAERWKSHELDGVALRHATGQFLLDTFGASTNRQKYGKSVMKNVSAALSVSISDLSRMRTFAFLCDDLARFREQYPECNTWTKVKAKLPLLAPNASGQKTQQKPKTKNRTSEDIHMSITELQKMLTDFDPKAGEKSTKLQEDLAALRQSIDTLLQALNGDATPQAPADEAVNLAV